MKTKRTFYKIKNVTYKNYGLKKCLILFTNFIDSLFLGNKCHKPNRKSICNGHYL